MTSGTVAKGNDITDVVVEAAKGNATNGIAGNGTYGMAAREPSEFIGVVVAAKPAVTMVDGVACRRDGFGVGCGD
mgnify:CR=1 FL=1